RFSKKESGAHSHYDKVLDKKDFIYKNGNLIDYKDNKAFFRKYLLQATSNIGIKLEDKTAVILGFVKEQNEDLLVEAIKRVKEQSFRNFDIFVYDNSEKP